MCLMKFLEYIGNYGKFQKGVIAEIHKNEMTLDQEAEYTKLYLRYKDCLSKKNTKQAEAIRSEMKEQYEKNFSYEKLVIVRTIATKKIEFLDLKKKEEVKVQEKIHQFELSKQTGIIDSFKGMFGFGKKTKEQEEQEKLETEAMRDQIERDAFMTIQLQNQQLAQQISMLKSTGKIQDNEYSAEFKELLGTDWVQFDINVTIPEIHLVLKRADNVQLVEMSVGNMISRTYIGLDFIETHFTLHTFSVRDHVSTIPTQHTTSPVLYQYLIETYIPPQDTFNPVIDDLSSILTPQQRNALNVSFVSNPRIAKVQNGSGCSLKLTVSSDSRLFIFANFDCINEVKDMLITAFSESNDSKAMFKYYKGLASEQLFKYVNEGSEYMLTIEETEQKEQQKKHNAIMLDLKMNAPVLFVPERYDQSENNQVLVIDLGNIAINSNLISFDPNRNYKLINNPTLLYDAYNFLLKDLKIMGFTSLRNYHQFSSPEVSANCVNLISDVSLKLNFYNNIEPRHPVRPTYEINVSLETMKVTASDYIFTSLMRLKDTILEKISPQDVKGSVISKQESGALIIEEMKQEEYTPGQIEEKTKCDQDQFEFEEGNHDGEISTKLEHSLSRRLSGQGADVVSMNVIVSIGYLELEIHEKVDSDELDFDMLLSSQMQHRELLKIRMSDLILNYYRDKTGVQTITIILTHFDIVDKQMIKGKNGTLQPLIPEIYSHIVSNPQFKIQRKITGLPIASPVKPQEYSSDGGNKLQQQFSLSSNGGGMKPNSQSDQTIFRRFNSNNSRLSGASVDFQSCISGASSVNSINMQEIERVAQIFTRIIIQQKTEMTQKIDIDFIFSEFRAIVSLPTFEKMFKFSKKFIQQKSQVEVEEDLFSMQMSLHSATLRESTMRGSTQEAGNLGVQRKASFKDNLMRSFEDSIIRRKSTIIEKIGMIEEEVLNKEIKKEQKIRFRGRFKSISLWVPLDSRINNSRVFSFSLQSQVTFRRDQLQIDTIDPTTSELKSSVVQTSHDEAIVTINQLQMEMINRHLLQMSCEEDKAMESLIEQNNLDIQIEEEADEVSTEKLLEPSRITLIYSNSIKDAGLKTNMNADINIEPFEVKIGFREIEFFNNLNKSVQDFLKVIDQKDDDIINLTRETEQDIDRKLLQFKNEELREQQKNKKNAKADYIKIRKEEQVQIMTVKFKCDTFRFSLMDDTGMQEYPVIFMNVRNIMFDLKKYEDVDDAAVFILKVCIQIVSRCLENGYSQKEER